MAEIDAAREVDKISSLAKNALKPQEFNQQLEAAKALGEEVSNLCKDPQYRKVMDELSSSSKGFTLTERPAITGDGVNIVFKNPYAQVMVDCSGYKGHIAKSFEK